MVCEVHVYRGERTVYKVHGGKKRVSQVHVHGGQGSVYQEDNHEERRTISKNSVYGEDRLPSAAHVHLG